MRLILGVTGHRILAEPEKIAAGVDRALAEIERAFPARPLVVLSALAEGADRLVAERALRHPTTALSVVLAMPPADYTGDFATPESRREFAELLARAEEIVELAPGGSREACYEAAGRHVVDRCAALIAIWDGQPAQGRGGTAAIVALARERRLPLAWVHAGNRRPGTSAPTSLGAEQGRLSLENL